MNERRTNSAILAYTEEGKRRAENYIRELQAKRKEILDAGKDTADETNIPTEDDLLSDVLFTGISWDDPDGPCYYNGWGVTDNYDSDLPILLKLDRDFTFTDSDLAEVVRIARRCRLTKDDLIQEAELVEDEGAWLHMSLLGYSAGTLMKAAELF